MAKGPGRQGGKAKGDPANRLLADNRFASTQPALVTHQVQGMIDHGSDEPSNQVFRFRIALPQHDERRLNRIAREVRTLQDYARSTMQAIEMRSHARIKRSATLGIQGGVMARSNF